MSAPNNLRVEHLVDPLGLTVRVPRLSWWLPEGTRRQSAYRIRAVVDGVGWDTGRVESDRSLFVPYGGPALRSGQRVSWAVKVWTDTGESAWSPTARWEMGLLEPEDWVASWIRPDEGAAVPPAGWRPGYLLRGEGLVTRPVRAARLYVTAQGVYEVFLNGTRVGDAELAPGPSAYRSRLQVQAYDVTELVTVGTNALGAIVSDGWYRGRTCYHRLPDGFGERTGLLAQLQVEHDDATRTVIGTGPGWRGTVGAIRAADLSDGQETDFRHDRPGWDRPGAAVTGWSPVRLAGERGDEVPTTRLVSSPAPPIRRLASLRPVAITRPRPGSQVVDFGQNIHGWVRLTRLGPAGTALALAHAEALDPVTGDVDPSTGEATIRWYEPPRGVQGDRVVSAGRPGDVFEPRHTRHGFRYLRIEGHPEEITADDVSAVVVGSDLPRTGWFQCSDERINQLYEVAFWTLRNQQWGTPTAEITRECSGGTDWGVNVPTGVLFHDVSGFSVSWLRDLAADQWPDGKIRNYAPDPLGPGSLTAHAAVPQGQAAWADAAVLVPWEIWRVYGDEELLAEQYPSMAAWVDYVATVAREQRHHSRRAARPDPAPHERFLWDTGYHFGEFLEPAPPRETPRPTQQELAWGREIHTLDEIDAFLVPVFGRVEDADHGIFATAYFHQSTALLARVAAHLGHAADAERYQALAASIRAAWQAEFVHADGTLAVDTQATHLRALAFGLVPDELREQTARRLVELIREAGTHPGTGLPSTRLLLPVLADTGHVDVAYELLFQDTEPSWLTTLDRGGTTFAEIWNGISADGHARLAQNFPARASVVEFLHGHVAGIAPSGDPDAPGYRRFRVAPRPGGGLTWAEARLDSPYGRVEASWRIEDGRFSLTVVVPPGTTAEITLPDGSHAEVEPGASVHTCALDREAVTA
ncbi:family 78 glycoside hydrolase catalytic domain [Parafrankia sp. EUN1f]|uniref:family 78 glycoside hydrolase catalytic domain n=1 Tax=Parafrankia sp. EUN1f TaxID=102897 RepID=UPI0001C45E6E|nr:family 78 glycoside hydrolase catalytic domain [Parafrankia sp. EUN1f]EFC82771.1 alpha-L-rhamnosidase [Parafrankia sp. EUN1f]